MAGTRTVDATLLTAAQKQSSPIVWFVELASPDTGTAGTLARQSTGLVHQLDTVDLSDTTDFTVHQGGSIDLGGVGGRLRLIPSGTLSTPIFVTYDSGSDPRDRITQIEFFRNVGVDTISGFPAVCVGSGAGATRITEDGDVRVTEADDPRVTEAGSYAPVYGIQKFVNAVGTTYPGGPYNEDSFMLHWDGTTSTNIGTTTNFSGHAQHPSILSYGADGLEIYGYVFPQAAGKLTRNPAVDPAGTTIDTSTPPSMLVNWEDSAADDYDDNVEVGHIYQYSSRYISFVWLPPNYWCKIKGGYPASHGNDITGTTSGMSGTALVPLDGEACPYDQAEVGLTGDASTNVTLTLTDDVWGGDVFQWTPPAPTPDLNLCTADETIDWDSKTWTGVGIDNLQFGGLKETGDLRAQRLEITFSAVSLSTVLANIQSTRHRGGIVRVWQAHYDPATGAMDGTPLLVFRGFTQDGWTAEEKYDRRGNPRGASLKMQVASRLAEFDVNPGIRTNLRAHQRWYPGDTGMQNVANAMKRIFWGQKGPGGTGFSDAVWRTWRGG